MNRKNIERRLKETHGKTPPMDFNSGYEYTFYRDYPRKGVAKDIARKAKKLGYLARVQPFKSGVTGRRKYMIWLARKEE